MLLEHLPNSWKVGCLYDIGCQIHHAVHKWDFALQWRECLRWGVSIFHAYRHQWAYQLWYHPYKDALWGLSKSAIQSLIESVMSLKATCCHDLQRSRACWTYFPWPQTRHVDPGSILAEQHTMPDEATKVGMQNTDAHICVPSLFSSQCVYIYLTSTGNFPSLEIN